LSCDDGADALGGDQPRVDRGDQGGDEGVDLGDLGGQLLVSAGQQA
jgi:hypothetical protein